MPNRKRITIFVTEPPVPATHGYRVDVWRRIEALQQLGASIQLVVISKDILTAHDRQELSRFVEDVVYFHAYHSLAWYGRLLATFWRYPLPVAVRWLSTADLGRLSQAISAFQPDAMLVEGVYLAHLAVRLSDEKPVFIRSHNIEHLYMHRQLKASTGLRTRANLTLANWTLSHYEHKYLKQSDRFFDISVDDLAFWKSKGFNNGAWLPPVYIGKAGIIRSESQKWDALYVGNLYVPGNVEALRWFFQECYPLILEKKPNFRVAIAGSKPCRTVIEFCASAPGITLIENPPSVTELYAQAAALFNPAVTGSGVNIKSVEMLMTGLPVISRSVGVVGLSNDIKSYFTIADQAQPFAAALLQPTTKCSPQDLQHLQNIFGIHSVQTILDSIPA